MLTIQPIDKNPDPKPDQPDWQALQDKLALARTEQEGTLVELKEKK